MNHFVEIYEMVDGSVYISPRVHQRTEPQILRDAHTSESQSPVYQALRTPGMFSGRRVIFSNLSKSQAESRAKVLIEFYRSYGRKVLNVKIG